MKKLIALVLAFVCVVLLVACASIRQKKVSVYSFYGENEYFAVSNGVMVLNSTEEVFKGGNLAIIQADCFADSQP